MATPLPHARVVFGGKFEPGFTLVSADIEDHDRMIDKATLLLDDPNGVAARVAEPGTPVVVEMGWEDENAILFHGLVEAPTTSQGNGTGRTQVVVYDDGILMHGDRRRETYTGLLSKVVEKVLGRYLPHFKVVVKADPDPEFTDKKPLVQVNLTDYEFLNQLAVHYGARSFVEWDPELQTPVYTFISNKELYEADPIGVLEYCCGASKLLEFTYQRVAGRARRQLVAAVMDPVGGSPVQAVGPPPPPPPAAAPSPTDPTSGPTAEALKAAQDKAKEKAATPATPNPLGPQPSDKERAETLTVQDPTRILGWTGKGRAIGTVKMAAKSMVTIKGIPSWAAGDWYIGMATHSYRRLVSGDQTTATYETSFVVTR